jgi:hypothetical protein
LGKWDDGNSTRLTTEEDLTHATDAWENASVDETGLLFTTKPPTLAVSKISRPPTTKERLPLN